MSIGFKIHQRARAVAASKIAQFDGIPTANISDCMSRVFGAPHALRPMHDGTALAGPAFTVRTRPGDNLIVHKALDIANPGDILVIDAGGDLSNAIIGELMSARAIQRKLAGIIVYGAIRDSDSIARGSFPVFALGITHRGPYKDGPGEINCRVSLGNLIIEPGDLIIGDSDGLVSIPYDLVDSVLKDACAKHIAEEHQMVAMRNGTIDRAWVDKALKERGCES